jgi:hypothetical protein
VQQVPPPWRARRRTWRVPSLVARVLLQAVKVEEGVAAHQALQLGGGEELQGGAAAEHEEALGKGLELGVDGAVEPEVNVELHKLAAVLLRDRDVSAALPEGHHARVAKAGHLHGQGLAEYVLHGAGALVLQQLAQRPPQRGLHVLQVPQLHLLPQNLAVQRQRQREVQQHAVVDGQPQHLLGAGPTGAQRSVGSC